MKLILIFASLLFFGYVPVTEMQKSYGHIQANYVLEKIQIASGYYEELDEVLIDVNLQLSEMPYIKASSFVMLHHKNNTYLSTSQHVCSELKDFITNEKFKKLGKKLLESMSEASFSIFDQVNLEYYVITPKVFIYDFYGKKHVLKDIIVSIPEKDMCVIRTEELWGSPVKLSEAQCKYEAIFNMSSSGGYYYPNSAPIRQGFINNVVKTLDIDNKIFTDVNLYTLQVKPGASGSAVFNSKGEVCGTINIAYVKVDLSSGNSLEDLKFLFEKTKSTL